MTQARNSTRYGLADRVLEYKTTVIPQMRWGQQGDGLHVSVRRAQRRCSNTRWANPIGLKITPAQPVKAVVG